MSVAATHRRDKGMLPANDAEHAGVGPRLITDPKLQPILDALKSREPIFHRPEFGTSRRDFDAMCDPDFWEVGASGQRYSRQYVLDTLEERHRHPHDDHWETSEFHLRQLATDLYLITYTLKQHERITRRCTLWRDTPDGWKIVYHQGTVASD
jgi:hypothetical protein